MSYSEPDVGFYSSGLMGRPVEGGRRFFDRRLETMGEDDLRGMQDRLVRSALAAVQSNPFYKKIYAEAGVDISRLDGIDSLDRLPIIRKADVLADMALDPPFGSRVCVPANRICNLVESSGTSGNTAELQALTADDLETVLDAEAVGFTWAGAQPGTVVALNLPVGMTAAGCWWHLTLYRMKCNVLRLGGMNTTRRLLYLHRYGANQMLIGSHYLRRLTQVAVTEGYDIARDFAPLDAIFVGGGGWTTAAVEQWSEQWGASIYEQYGSSQRCIAWTCELGAVHAGRRGVVHGLPHMCLMEVVDPSTGRAVEDGGEGEIVITVFNQEAAPLVRYGTGDRAIRRVGRSCPCGRCFDGIEAGSVSRVDEMLRVRGTNLWPEVVDRIVFDHEGIIDYRAEVWIDSEANERVSMTAEVRPGMPSEAREQLAQVLGGQLKAGTQLRFDLELHPAADGEMESATRADAKPRRWRDRRSELV